MEAPLEYFLMTLLIQPLTQVCTSDSAGQSTSNKLSLQTEIYTNKCKGVHIHTEYAHWTHKYVAATGKQAVQLDIHISPNWELYKLLGSSRCQQKVN